MAELVHRHVVPLVVHAPLGDPGPQVGLVLPPQRLRGMAGAPRRIDRDALREPLRPLRREAQPFEEVGEAAGEGGEVGVARPRGAVELLLRMVGPRLEAGVPDVERLERPAEPPLDQPPELRHRRRGQDRDQEILDLPLGDLALPLEAAGEEGRLGRAVGVDRPHRVEDAEQGGVAGVRLAGGEIPDPLCRRALHGSDLVGLGVPEQVGIVDHRRRDLLADDALHHLEDQPLPGEPVRLGSA